MSESTKPKSVDEEEEKKKKKKSIRDVKKVLWGDTKSKKALMDEIGDYGKKP